MSGPAVAAMVCSLHAHSGKTLLARVLAEHFILSGRAPLIFDTDALERRLAACFPDAVVVDLAQVPEQMILFDSLAWPSPEPRVVDVAHQTARQHFDGWLGGEPDPHDVLEPFRSALLKIWPISTRVNSPLYDDDHLLDEINDPEAKLRTVAAE